MPVVSTLVKRRPENISWADEEFVDCKGGWRDANSLESGPMGIRAIRNYEFRGGALNSNPNNTIRIASNKNEFHKRETHGDRSERQHRSD